MTDKLGMTTLPKGGEKSYAIQMSQYLGINKDSKNKEAATLFVNFFVTSPEAGAVLQTTSNFQRKWRLRKVRGRTAPHLYIP